MALSLNPALEQRIEREVERGQFPDSSTLVARALDLLESEQNWLLENREAINDRLDMSFVQAENGQSYSLDEASRILEERSVARHA